MAVLFTLSVREGILERPSFHPFPYLFQVREQYTFVLPIFPAPSVEYGIP